MSQSINWWAVGAAVVLNFVIGGLWYSPPVFFKPWLRMAGVTPAVFNAGLARALIADLLASCAMAGVLLYILRAAGAVALGQGLEIAFLVWLGFIASVLVTSVTYEHRPVAFYAINASYRLISILGMGAILTL